MLAVLELMKMNPCAAETGEIIIGKNMSKTKQMGKILYVFDILVLPIIPLQVYLFEFFAHIYNVTRGLVS
jgi:hypothetical protein